MDAARPSQRRRRLGDGSAMTFPLSDAAIVAEARANCTAQSQGVLNVCLQMGDAKNGPSAALKALATTGRAHRACIRVVLSTPHEGNYMCHGFALLQSAGRVRVVQAWQTTLQRVRATHAMRASSVAATLQALRTRRRYRDVRAALLDMCRRDLDECFEPADLVAASFETVTWDADADS